MEGVAFDRVRLCQTFLQYLHQLQGNKQAEIIFGGVASRVARDQDEYFRTFAQRAGSYDRVDCGRKHVHTNVCM